MTAIPRTVSRKATVRRRRKTARRDALLKTVTKPRLLLERSESGSDLDGQPAGPSGSKRRLRGFPYRSVEPAELDSNYEPSERRFRSRHKA